MSAGRIGPWARKLSLPTHLAVSVGWIGAVAAYVALDVTVATGESAEVLRASYLAMELIARAVIVPLAITSLVSGIVVSLTTRWGLFRHYWVVISLVLTAAAVGILLREIQVISHLAAVAGDPATSPDELRGLGSTLVHSIGGLVVLLVVLVLNVYKPRGLTRYGRRREAR